MNKVKNFFDDFTFHARVMPIMVVTMPIVIAAISKGILQGGWSENTGLILLSLVYFNDSIRCDLCTIRQQANGYNKGV